MKHIIFSAMVMLGLCAPAAIAQGYQPEGKYSIKANANIGLGGAYSASSTVGGVDLDKSGNSSFGVDFRYRFWTHNDLSLGLNTGLAYATGSQTVDVNGLKFNYAAGADADMDGDTYQRHTEVGHASQKVSSGELAVPVYVDFDWRFSRRVSLYANAGLAFRIATSVSAKEVDGSCSVHGIYPQYGDLMVADEWMNDFGDRSLSGASTGKPQYNSFTMSVRGGAGLRVWIYGPLSLECGVNYEYGMMNTLKSGSFASGNVTAESAPVTYTVAGGRQVKPLSEALNKDKLSNLSLNLGLIFNF